MFLFLSFRISKSYNRVNPYFYKRKGLLIFCCVVAYFLAMNLSFLEFIKPYYSIIIPLDFYLFLEEVKKHKYGLLDSMEETEIDVKDIPVLPYEDKQKMTDFIKTVYKYLKNKKNLNFTEYDFKKPGIELLESTQTPENIDLKETMMHTIDNIAK